MIRKTIDEGSWIPKGYGPAWDMWQNSLSGPNRVVCYPVPINYIFAWIRLGYLFCKFGTHTHRIWTAWLKKRTLNFDVVYEQGLHDGYQRGWIDAQYHKSVPSESPYVLPMSSKTKPNPDS